MKGQWSGRYEGTNSGTIVIDIDDHGSYFSGHARLFTENFPGPITHAVLQTSDKSEKFSIEPLFFYIDPATGLAIPPNELTTRYPTLTFPKKVTATGSWDEKELIIEWKTDIGTYGSAKLPVSVAGEPSEYEAQKLSWTEFKSVVGAIEPRRCIFRGQEQQWRLRTAFHRSKRSDLVRFLSEDVPTLYRALSSRTRHIYDLRVPEQNGAFLHLAQHHGYPTPLLDWSYSPFVAAFCAYRKIDPNNLSDLNARIRIFVFDQTEWRNDWEQLQNLTIHKAHFSILEFLAIDNDRVVPQQALSCLTNIDDIETYVRLKEKEKQKTYLRVFDLPAVERTAVMLELSVMGITAGSMFPGLDGACEEIRERLFKY